VSLRGSSILIYEVLGIAKLCWKPALQDHTLSLMSSDPNLIILGDVSQYPIGSSQVHALKRLSWWCPRDKLSTSSDIDAVIVNKR